ncbi:MAG TPA: hypothetical protein VFW33_12030, partial [Gemmataceae bacterium]|nr:hypothetical protein [Gemmataceae bacterium]
SLAMPAGLSPRGGAPPGWLVAAGSAVIVFHLAAIVIPVLDTPSGPWATPMGRMPGDAPAFAHEAAPLANLHSDYLRVAHSYSFVTNRPGDIPGVRFEAVLRDKEGNVTTLKFPDPNANPWVRHRQELLATLLAPDLPAEKPLSDVIAPPGEKPAMVDIWALPGEDFTASAGPPTAPPDRKLPLHLEHVPQFRLRYRDYWKPTDLSVVLARSYARYLCRAHGAASAEIVRYTREPVAPDVLFGRDAVDLTETVASYGEKTE